MVAAEYAHLSRLRCAGPPGRPGCCGAPAPKHHVARPCLLDPSERRRGRDCQSPSTESTHPRYLLGLGGRAAQLLRKADSMTMDLRRNVTLYMRKTGWLQPESPGARGELWEHEPSGLSLPVPFKVSE